jgi:hypothetical protein
MRTADVAEGVVLVVTDRYQGSGCLLAPRLVLTAAHVVDDSETIRVGVPGGRSGAVHVASWSGPGSPADAMWRCCAPPTN